MEKEQIIQMLSKNHGALVQKINSLSEEDFQRLPGPKWSAGQQLDHVLKSVVPIAKAFNVPITVLESKFGLAERPSKNYSELVATYLDVLKTLKDFSLPERFVPAQIPVAQRGLKLIELQETVTFLNHGISRTPESVLDSHAMVHPAMGRLTLREMLYFTAYHVTHHDEQILKNLNAYSE